MQHLQPNTTLQGGKYRKLRVSESKKNFFATLLLFSGAQTSKLGGFLISLARAGFPIERVLVQGGFGNKKRNKTLNMMANEIIKYEQQFEEIRGIITILPISELVQLELH